MQAAVPKRAFGASAMTAQAQFDRMEAIYQGYFTPERQKKIICIGRNYRAHVAEMSEDLPTEPMWFDKPMCSLLPPGKPLKLVPGLHDNMHHEIEMGIVIGMRGRSIRREDALKHVAGYFVGVDFTNRTLQRLNKDTGADWVLAKGSNDFAAVSDFIHKSAVADVGNVELELQVNGQTRQQASTSQMIFDLPAMIEDISRY